MLNYKVYNSTNVDVHVILIANYTIIIRFIVLEYWMLVFKLVSDDNFKCLYLPMLDISVNNNEK